MPHAVLGAPSGRLCPANAIDHLAYPRDHQIRIIELNPVATGGRDDMLPDWRKTGEPPMPVKYVPRLIAARDHHERDIGQRRHSADYRRCLFQRGEMIGHRSETFWLAPERLYEGMHLGRELAYLTNKALDGTRRSRSE